MSQFYTYIAICRHIFSFGSLNSHNFATNYCISDFWINFARTKVAMAYMAVNGVFQAIPVHHFRWLAIQSVVFIVRSAKNRSMILQFLMTNICWRSGLYLYLHKQIRQDYEYKGISYAHWCTIPDNSCRQSFAKAQRNNDPSIKGETTYFSALQSLTLTMSIDPSAPSFHKVAKEQPSFFAKQISKNLVKALKSEYELSYAGAF